MLSKCSHFYFCFICMYNLIIISTISTIRSWLFDLAHIFYYQNFTWTRSLRNGLIFRQNPNKFECLKTHTNTKISSASKKSSSISKRAPAPSFPERIRAIRSLPRPTWSHFPQKSSNHVSVLCKDYRDLSAL